MLPIGPEFWFGDFRFNTILNLHSHNVIGQLLSGSQYCSVVSPACAASTPLLCGFQYSSKYHDIHYCVYTGKF